MSTLVPAVDSCHAFRVGKHCSTGIRWHTPPNSRQDVAWWETTCVHPSTHAPCCCNYMGLSSIWHRSLSCFRDSCNIYTVRLNSLQRCIREGSHAFLLTLTTPNPESTLNTFTIKTCLDSFLEHFWPRSHFRVCPL